MDINDHPPLEIIYEGILYRKEFDGNYHKFNVGAELYARKNSIGMISIREVREILQSVKFSKPILYCTNDVNKKI